MTCRTLGRVRQFILVLAFGAWILLATGAMAQSQGGTSVVLGAAVETFLSIAERGEYGEAAIGATRWSRPVRIATAGVPTEDQKAALSEHVVRLSARTGLAMEIATPLAASSLAGADDVPFDLGDPRSIFQIIYHLPVHGWTTYLVHGTGDRLAVARGDVMVVFANHRSAAQIARILRMDSGLVGKVASGSMPCYAFFYTEPVSHEIKYGIVVLRTDVPEWMRRRCLHEELTQVMGLRSDVRGSEITLFDDMPMKRRTELTPYDWLFLEVLYDPRLKPGTSGAELRRVARELIEERWPPR